MKTVVEERGIKFLWHFTRLANLEGILNEGLKSRQELECRAVCPDFNDEYRIDGHRDAICCSLSHPNYKMFYSLRMQHPELEWAVLGLRPKVLWEKDCAFCIENAASNNVTCVPIDDRKGIEAFQNLFEEIGGKPSRKDLGISDACPTNPQAEILIFDAIEPEYIIGAVFQTRERAVEYQGKFPQYQLVYHKAHFMPRTDYTHWK